jgi:hypothetical protein
MNKKKKKVGEVGYIDDFLEDLKKESISDYDQLKGGEEEEEW